MSQQYYGKSSIHFFLGNMKYTAKKNFLKAHNLFACLINA